MPSVKNYSRTPFGARPVSDHVCARAAVTTFEQFTVPAGATMVILQGTLPFHVAFGVNPQPTVPTDLDDGTAPELINPATPDESRTFGVTPGDKIGVCAATSAMITASFFKQ